MFSESLQPTGCDYRMTPCTFEMGAGRHEWPPKSRQATGLRRATERLGRRALGDGYAVRRDDLRQGIIQMFTPENKTPSTGKALGADEAAEATNLNKTDGTSPASVLLAEADRIIATFPSFMTRKGKHQAESRVLRLFLAALAASRQEMAV